MQSPNSGVAVTYEYMTQLEPKFKNTAPAFVDTMEALLQIKAGGQNKIKAAMLVQRPSAKSPAMQVVLDNPEEFHFVPVKDWDLNDKLPDGRAVYTFENVTVEEKNGASIPPWIPFAPRVCWWPPRTSSARNCGRTWPRSCSWPVAG
ncbi:MAG: hypothetical protein R3F37_04760 [Candidatus Competibacteraceae bacterium]